MSFSLASHSRATHARNWHANFAVVANFAYPTTTATYKKATYKAYGSGGTWSLIG
jgi:hypothetical protein